MTDNVEFRDHHSTWTVEVNNGSQEPQLRILRIGRGIENMDRDFDELFWQTLGSTAISQAACELVEVYLTSKGRTNDIRLQRAVGGLKRVRRTIPNCRRLRGNEVHGATPDERP